MRGHAALLFAFGIAALALLGVPLCPIANVFDVPCPGCGLTRAGLALLHGDLDGALRFHPGIFALAPAFGVAGSVAVSRRARGLPAPWAERWVETGAAVLVVLFVGIWVARFFGALGGPVSV